MKRLLLILFLGSLTLLPTTGSAGWWYEKHFGSGQELITNNAFNFKLDDIKCHVTEVKYFRTSDSSVDEYRDLICRVSNDISVSIRAHCEYPLYSMTEIKIYKKDKFYWPTLICGPARKNNK